MTFSLLVVLASPRPPCTVLPRMCKRKKRRQRTMENPPAEDPDGANAAPPGPALSVPVLSSPLSSAGVALTQAQPQAQPQARAESNSLVPTVGTSETSVMETNQSISVEASTSHGNAPLDISEEVVEYASTSNGNASEDDLNSSVEEDGSESAYPETEQPPSEELLDQTDKDDRARHGETPPNLLKMFDETVLQFKSEGVPEPIQLGDVEPKRELQRFPFPFLVEHVVGARLQSVPEWNNHLHYPDYSGWENFNVEIYQTNPMDKRQWESDKWYEYRCHLSILIDLAQQLSTKFGERLLADFWIGKNFEICFHWVWYNYAQLNCPTTLRFHPDGRSNEELLANEVPAFEFKLVSPLAMRWLQSRTSARHYLYAMILAQYDKYAYLSIWSHRLRTKPAMAYYEGKVVVERQAYLDYIATSEALRVSIVAYKEQLHCSDNPIEDLNSARSFKHLVERLVADDITKIRYAPSWYPPLEPCVTKVYTSHMNYDAMARYVANSFIQKMGEHFHVSSDDRAFQTLFTPNAQLYINEVHAFTAAGSVQLQQPDVGAYIFPVMPEMGTLASPKDALFHPCNKAEDLERIMYEGALIQFANSMFDILLYKCYLGDNYQPRVPPITWQLLELTEAFLSWYKPIADRDYVTFRMHEWKYQKELNHAAEAEPPEPLPLTRKKADDIMQALLVLHAGLSDFDFYQKVWEELFREFGREQIIIALDIKYRRTNPPILRRDEKSDYLDFSESAWAVPYKEAFLDVYFDTIARICPHRPHFFRDPDATSDLDCCQDLIDTSHLSWDVRIAEIPAHISSRNNGDLIDFVASLCWMNEMRIYVDGFPQFHQDGIPHIYWSSELEETTADRVGMSMHLFLEVHSELNWTQTQIDAAIKATGHHYEDGQVDTRLNRRSFAQKLKKIADDVIFRDGSYDYELLRSIQPGTKRLEGDALFQTVAKPSSPIPSGSANAAVVSPSHAVADTVTTPVIQSTLKSVVTRVEHKEAQAGAAPQNDGFITVTKHKQKAAKPADAPTDAAQASGGTNTVDETHDMVITEIPMSDRILTTIAPVVKRFTEVDFNHVGVHPRFTEPLAQWIQTDEGLNVRACIAHKQYGVQYDADTLQPMMGCYMPVIFPYLTFTKYPNPAKNEDEMVSLFFMLYNIEVNRLIFHDRIPVDEDLWPAIYTANGWKGPLFAQYRARYQALLRYFGDDVKYLGHIRNMRRRHLNEKSLEPWMVCMMRQDMALTPRMQTVSLIAYKAAWNRVYQRQDINALVLLNREAGTQYVNLQSFGARRPYRPALPTMSPQFLQPDGRVIPTNHPLTIQFYHKPKLLAWVVPPPTSRTERVDPGGHVAAASNAPQSAPYSSVARATLTTQPSTSAQSDSDMACPERKPDESVREFTARMVSYASLIGLSTRVQPLAAKATPPPAGGSGPPTATPGLLQGVKVEASPVDQITSEMTNYTLSSSGASQPPPKAKLMPKASSQPQPQREAAAFAPAAPPVIVPIDSTTSTAGPTAVDMDVPPLAAPMEAPMSLVVHPRLISEYDGLPQEWILNLKPLIGTHLPIDLLEEVGSQNFIEHPDDHARVERCLYAQRALTGLQVANSSHVYVSGPTAVDSIVDAFIFQSTLFGNAHPAGADRMFGLDVVYTNNQPPYHEWSEILKQNYGIRPYDPNQSRFITDIYVTNVYGDTLQFNMRALTSASFPFHPGVMRLLDNPNHIFVLVDWVNILGALRSTFHYTPDPTRFLSIEEHHADFYHGPHLLPNDLLSHMLITWLTWVGVDHSILRTISADAWSSLGDQVVQLQPSGVYNIYANILADRTCLSRFALRICIAYCVRLRCRPVQYLGAGIALARFIDCSRSWYAQDPLAADLFQDTTDIPAQLAILDARTMPLTNQILKLNRDRNSSLKAMEFAILPSNPKVLSILLGILIDTDVHVKSLATAGFNVNQLVLKLQAVERFTRLWRVTFRKSLPSSAKDGGSGGGPPKPGPSPGGGGSGKRFRPRKKSRTSEGSDSRGRESSFQGGRDASASNNTQFSENKSHANDPTQFPSNQSGDRQQFGKRGRGIFRVRGRGILPREPTGASPEKPFGLPRGAAKMQSRGALRGSRPNRGRRGSQAGSTFRSAFSISQHESFSDDPSQGDDSDATSNDSSATNEPKRMKSNPTSVDYLKRAAAVPFPIKRNDESAEEFQTRFALEYSASTTQKLELMQFAAIAQAEEADSERASRQESRLRRASQAKGSTHVSRQNSKGSGSSKKGLGTADAELMPPPAVIPPKKSRSQSANRPKSGSSTEPATHPIGFKSSPRRLDETMSAWTDRQKQEQQEYVKRKADSPKGSALSPLKPKGLQNPLMPRFVDETNEQYSKRLRRKRQRVTKRQNLAAQRNANIAAGLPPGPSREEGEEDDEEDADDDQDDERGKLLF